jgi:hypothetical protein
MATISNTPRPGYAYDSTDDVWYPIGTGPHTHGDYITQATAINPTIVDAKGDIIAASAADTVARLAVGANDTVLTADSSTATGLKWATPAAGGMTLLSTTTLTGASITLSSIPQTYNNLQLIIRDYLPTDDARGIRVRFNGDTSNYYASRARGVEDIDENFNLSSFEGSSGNDNAVTNSLFVYRILDYANTVTWKISEMMSLATGATTTTQYNMQDTLGFYNQNTAISSITLFPFAGSFTSGTALLYGVK